MAGRLASVVVHRYRWLCRAVGTQLGPQLLILPELGAAAHRRRLAQRDHPETETTRSQLVGPTAGVLGPAHVPCPLTGTRSPEGSGTVSGALTSWPAGRWRETSPVPTRRRCPVRPGPGQTGRQRWDPVRSRAAGRWWSVCSRRTPFRIVVGHRRACPDHARLTSPPGASASFTGPSGRLTVQTTPRLPSRAVPDHYAPCRRCRGADRIWIASRSVMCSRGVVSRARSAICRGLSPMSW